MLIVILSLKRKFIRYNIKPYSMKENKNRINKNRPNKVGKRRKKNGSSKIRPVLVDFYADWCGPCKMMGPVVEEISGELDDVKVCKINIDEEMEVAQRYGVMSIPTFIAFKNGEMTGKQVGAVPKGALADLVK